VSNIEQTGVIGIGYAAKVQERALCPARPAIKGNLSLRW